MSYDNAHSRLVAWAKLVLPLGALAILSTMFLFSGRVDPQDAIPYASVDVEELARKQRLTSPQYSGMTEDGASVIVRAATATPDPGGSGAGATAVMMKIQSASGLVTDIAAKTGRIDPNGGKIALGDGVTIATSAGYRLQTDSLVAATDRTSVVAPAAVSAVAPFGTLTAGGMQMTSDDGGVTNRMVFNGGVKLVYQPEK